MSNNRIDSYRMSEWQPLEYLNGMITDSQLIAFGQHASVGLRSAEVEAMEALLGHEITEVPAALAETAA
jgi:RNA polymerase sigma-70 factor (ECF subfamily)